MPRKYEVDQHPHKDRIIKALARGDTYREITGRYGVTKSALSRYLREKLLPKAAEAKEAQDLRDGAQLLKEIERIMERVNKMYDACDAYLQDPQDPSRYYLGPRGEEIRVVYVELDEEGNPSRKTDTLQVLLDRLSGRNVLEVRYKHADPRELVLKSALTLKSQLELLARVQGQIKDIAVNITAIAQWAEIKMAILEATKGSPDVRARIVEGLKAIAGD